MSNSQAPDAAAAVSQAAGPVPRYHLPDDWTGKGSCPVCRTPGQLRVQHQDTAPDRMLCGACGSAFEVETGGARICLTVAPPGMSAAGVLDTWLTPVELRLALARVQAASLPAASPFEELAAATPPVATQPVAPTQEDSNPAAVVMLAEPAATEAAAPVPAMAAEGTAHAVPAAVGDANPPLAAPLLSNGASIAAAPEPEPGSDDWFASLAAVIGGVTPVMPPSDEVLADELERLLTTRAESGANGAAEHTPEGAPAAEPQGAPPGQPASPTLVGMAAPEAAAPSLAPAEVPAPRAPATPNGAPAATLATPAADLPELGRAVLAVPVDPGAAVSASAAAAASTAAATPESAAAAPDAMVPQAAMTALKASMLAEPPPGGASTPVPVSRRELAERAWKLHELGNSLPSIQAALESQGGTPDDISTIMAKLVALEQARRDRFQRNLYWAIGIAAGVVMLLLAIAIVLSLSPAPAATGPSVTALGTASAAQIGTSAPGQTTTTTVTAPTATLTFNPLVALLNQLIPGDVKIANGPPPTPMPTSSLFGGLFPAAPTAAATGTPNAATPGATSSGLPAWVATLVPHGITVLNVPTPSVDHSGPPAGPCPTTPAQAAALFGGAAVNWTYNRQEQGWIFILASSPATLKLPSGMSAGYLVIGDQLEMRSTTGPATIHNVNFAAVSCS